MAKLLREGQMCGGRAASDGGPGQGGCDKLCGVFPAIGNSRSLFFVRAPPTSGVLALLNADEV